MLVKYKKYIHAWLMILLFGHISNVYGYSNITPAINKIFIKHNIKSSTIGVSIKELNGGKIYDLNGSSHFIPASLLKIPNAAACLETVGPNYRFYSDVAYKAGVDLEKGKLNSDIYFKFSGDPSFSFENLQSLIEQIKDHGIHNIAGNILIDTSATCGSQVAMGWTHDSIPWYYSAPSSAVIIDENKYKLILHSASKQGDLARIISPDRYPALEINAHVKSVSKKLF